VGYQIWTFQTPLSTTGFVLRWHSMHREPLSPVTRRCHPAPSLEGTGEGAVLQKAHQKRDRGEELAQRYLEDRQRRTLVGCNRT
jgi:hypothetical protein